MSQTQEVSVTLPLEAFEHMRQRIAAGDFATASEYVETLLVSDMLGEPPTSDSLAGWMKTEGIRRLQALHNNPGQGLTADQAFAGLLDEEESA